MRLWRKRSRKGVDRGAQRVSQMDPYDYDSSDGVPNSLCSPQSPNPPFNDPSYETYNRSQQFMIISYTANQRNGSEGQLSCQACEEPTDKTSLDERGYIPLSRVQSLYVVELELPLRTRLAR